MHPTTATYIQLILLVFYIVLAVLFSLDRKTWPFAAYYIGCLVKDTAVYILALFK